MVNVRFYGSLKQFGSEFRLDCQTTAEIVQALTSQIPKLRQFIQQGLFTVRVGRDYFDNRYLEQDSWLCWGVSIIGWRCSNAYKNA